MISYWWFPLFIALAYSLAGNSHAAANVIPIFSGYSAGKLSSVAGSFTVAAANDGYLKPAIANVGGRAITVPATLRMAANAGQYAKQAMRFNPYVLAGTLAAGWLLDHGLSYENEQWVKADTSDGLGYDTCTSGQIPGTQTEAYMRNAILSNPQNHWYGCNAWHDCSASNGGTYCQGWGSSPAGLCAAYQCHGQPNPQTQPATDEDWDALPSPLPIIAPELPYAPYMPGGVPVDAPEYDFAPFRTPIGEPYTKADGSTARPMATVSPNGDSVTVDTYDEPVTDPQGQPIQNPAPQDTPEPDISECQQHPNTIGCAEFGAVPAPDSLTTLQVPVSPTVTPVGGPGSCPADITTSIYGLTWSYQPICDFASAIRPLIIGFAWLAFAYIVAGTVRT